MARGDVCAFIVIATAGLSLRRPPLSLRDISPTRGEIGREFSTPSVRWPKKFMAISPLVGEMSRRDREGYETPSSKHNFPSVLAHSR